MELCLYAPGLGYYSAGRDQVRRRRRFRHRAGTRPVVRRLRRRRVAPVLRQLGPGGAIRRTRRRQRRLRRGRAEAPAAHWTHCPRATRSSNPAPTCASASANACSERLTRCCSTWSNGSTRRRSIGMERRAVRQRSDRRVADAALHPARRRRLRGARRARWRRPLHPRRPARRCAAAPRPCATSSASSMRRSPMATAPNCCRSCRTGCRRWSAACASGALLFVDYGHPRREYYQPQRSDGTLRAFHRHRVSSDVYALAGPAGPDRVGGFHRARRSLRGAGFDFSGYCSQASFLIGNGLEQRLAEAEADAPDEAARFRAAPGNQTADAAWRNGRALPGHGLRARCRIRHGIPRRRPELAALTRPPGRMPSKRMPSESMLSTRMTSTRMTSTLKPLRRPRLWLGLWWCAIGVVFAHRCCRRSCCPKFRPGGDKLEHFGGYCAARRGGGATVRGASAPCCVRLSGWSLLGDRAGVRAGPAHRRRGRWTRRRAGQFARRACGTGDGADAAARRAAAFRQSRLTHGRWRQVRRRFRARAFDRVDARAPQRLAQCRAFKVRRGRCPPHAPTAPRLQSQQFPGLRIGSRPRARRDRACRLRRPRASCAIRAGWRNPSQRASRSCTVLARNSNRRWTLRCSRHADRRQLAMRRPAPSAARTTRATARRRRLRGRCAWAARRAGVSALPRSWVSAAKPISASPGASRAAMSQHQFDVHAGVDFRVVFGALRHAVQRVDFRQHHAPARRSRAACAGTPTASARRARASVPATRARAPARRQFAAGDHRAHQRHRLRRDLKTRARRSAP